MNPPSGQLGSFREPAVEQRLIIEARQSRRRRLAARREQWRRLELEPAPARRVTFADGDLAEAKRVYAAVVALVLLTVGVVFAVAVAVLTIAAGAGAS